MRFSGELTEQAVVTEITRTIGSSKMARSLWRGLLLGMDSQLLKCQVYSVVLKLGRFWGARPLPPPPVLF